MLDQQRPLRGIRQKLGQLRIPELRNVLTDLNLQRSGRKSELVDRIAATLETMEQKASDSGGNNQAMNAFYRDQFKSAISSVERQMMPPATRQGAAPPPPSHAQPLGSYGGAAPVSRYASGPAVPSPSQAAVPPVRRNIPNYSRFQSQHQRFNQPTHAPQQYGSAATPATSSVVTSAGGADFYKAAISSELNGARCFCGSGGGQSGKVVECTKCALRVHAKCHQLITMSGEWHCERCRAEIFDPFFTTKRTVLEPTFVRFMRASSVMRLEYTIHDRDLNELYTRRDPNPGSMTPGSLELQLRCFAVKDDLAAGHCWPATTQLYVNSFGVPITQRAPPGSANPSKVLRELPANIYQYSRVGRNVIEIRTTDNPALFAFQIQVVEIRNVNTLIEEVKEASKNITYESAKQQVIASFGGSADDDDDDDDGIEAMCTMLSIRCPLGLCVINLPARGRYCKHLQCFDLKTFLVFNRKARSKAWRCTVCHNFIKAADLRVDPYLKKLLADVAGEEELEEVEIFPDGTWRRRVGEELPPPPPKRVKTEHIEDATPSAPTNLAAATTEISTSTTPADVGSSAAAPVEIDLSLSSDEEEDNDDTQAAAAAAAAAIGSRPASSSDADARTTLAVPASSASIQPILMDDDLGILRVDNDAWVEPDSITAGDGTDESYFTFPLDDAIFGSGSAVSPSVSASTSTTTSWNAGSTTATAISPPVDLLNESEVSLANAMANLSRNHPNVSNPFDRRRPAVAAPTTSADAPATPTATAAAIAAAARTASRLAPPKPTAQPDPLDIIYLLDSDSE